MSKTCRKCSAELPPEALFCHLCGAKQEVTVRPHGVKKRGNGQGSVYKRSNGWEAAVTVYRNGVRSVRTKSGFATKKEALASLPALASSKVVRQEQTISELWNGYAAQLSKLSKSKQDAYAAAWRKLSAIHDVSVSVLTVADLQGVIDDKATSYYTAKDMKMLLSHLYKLACAQGDAQNNLAAHIVLPDLVESERKPFSPEEVRKIWAAFADGDTFAGYILLMIYTGMMPGELLKLEKRMINWNNCEIVGVGIKTKERKRKSVIVPELVLPVLESLCSSADGEKVVSVSRDTFYDQFHAAMRRIGCREDLTPYSCRHTTGTELAVSEANIPPSVIQRIMRHSKFSTTQRYIHPTTSDALAAVNSVFKS